MKKLKILTDSNNLKCPITWVCFECGNKARSQSVICGHKFRTVVSIMHTATCDVCQVFKDVTHVRDFGFPDFKGIGKFKETK